MKRSLLFLLLVLAGSLFAQDVVTVGTVTASGSSVDVPVSIRDVSGTPLGMDRPAGSKIQSFSIKVDYAPASALTSVSFSRAGITASLSPTSEFKPSSPGSTSLLATFQESTNPIPFTLNQSAPGDLVAHLVFTLSPSVAPGTTITLSLDSALTQLTDEGGTAATKETVSNGALALVDGAIEVPQLSITLNPSSMTVFAGSSEGMSVVASSTVASDTTVTLSSTASGKASVPASVVISAGTRTASFLVDGVSVGSATINAALPQSVGGGTASATVNVTDAPPTCAIPPTPQITAPSTAVSGATYAVSWPAVANATEYSIEEANNAAFTNSTKQTVTTTSVSYSHAVGAEQRFYYRVRAFNKATGCNQASSFSATVSVLVTPAPVALPKRVFTVVGSTPGGFGSYFRTSVQFYNPGTSTISGRIVFHPAGLSATDADPFLAYTLGAGRTLAYSDLLPLLGVTTGLGSADVYADAGSTYPIAISRIFNDAGELGTTGLSQDLLRLDEALQTGQTGVLLAPADMVLFRLNVGVRTLDAGATITITARNAEGEVVKTVQKNFGPSYFIQISSPQLLDGYLLTGGETLSFHIDAGSAFIYGATTDNKTNDPSQQFARTAD